MSAEAVTETAPSSEPRPRRRTWVYVLVVVFVVICFGYLSLINTQDSVANHDFYRVLYEASNKFNENLDQLDRMHKSLENESVITSLLPSYTEKKDARKPGFTKNLDYNYKLDGKYLEINVVKAKDAGEPEEAEKAEEPGKTGKPAEAYEFEAQLKIEDILPPPKQGFSRYLFADKRGTVLAAVGDEKTISIVDLTSINREIRAQKRRFRINLEEQKGTAGKQDEPPLPSHSSHVDMQLSYGEFRIFIFPFSLANKIEIENCIEDDEPCRRNKLYLVGLLPKQQLITNGSGHWNVSLLLVTLVSLLFMWTLMRVYLLPRSQSITSMYRGFTMVSSYGFYVVVIALVLAFLQKTALQTSKDAAAFDYAEKLYRELNADLFQVFDCLAAYRPFYHTLVKGLDNFNAVGDKNAVRNATPEADKFSRMITQSLDSLTGITNASCNNVHEALLPEYAWTPHKTYHIALESESDEGKPVWRFNPELDEPADQEESAERVMLNAYQENTEDLNSLAFVAGNLTNITLKPNDTTSERNDNTSEPNNATSETNDNIPKPKFTSYINPYKDSYLPSNIFTVFAFNDGGNTTLPPIFYQEKNAPPKTSNLSHRDYYKKVRDTNGWQLCRSPEERKRNKCRFNNVYVQRLLNINDGSRGTTISMPMFDPKDPNMSSKRLAGYTMGADVILPSLSLAAPAPYDFTYMVINRSSGNVLFHSDESRTLVENIFYAGNGKSNLSQWIKAGLDHYPKLSENAVKGHYHGQAGRFALIPSPVDAWAIVVFYPNDSLDSLMTNQFLFVSVSFAIALLILTGLLIIGRHFVCTHTLKRRLCIPAKISGRMLIISGSILLSAIYSLYNIGLLFDLAMIDEQSVGTFSLLIPGLGLLLLLYSLFRVCTVRFKDIDPTDHSATSGKGLKRLFAAAVVLAALHLGYLHYAAETPLKGLEFHYQQLYCNGLNYERQENIRMGLRRYPNSVTQQRRDPLELLPMRSELLKKLQGEENACDQHSSQVEPDDYPTLSTLVGATYLWQWINTYLLTADLPISPVGVSEHKLNLAFWPLFSACILLPSIIFGWLVFNRRVLWNRFYCPDRFLQHIESLTRSESTLPQDQRNEKLTIECDTTKLNGIGLALLLRSASMQDAKTEQIMSNKLLPGFAELYKRSPCLQKLGANNSFLPNLKLNIEQGPKKKGLNVQIWDIETCLEKVEFRQHLLDLIMEIKSLTLAGQLTSFTIFTGFHSLQRVKMKDPLLVEDGSILEHAEYLSWAECLMDFNVKVPDAFKRGLDTQLLQQEIADFPELFFLSHDEQKPDGNAARNKREDNDIDSKWWNTINYILLHADALYRFKWESCSNAEKLALFNLTKNRRLNPANTQMIEQLAINGLIKVKHGQLEITNDSFAHFILNAETTDTLNRLFHHSQEGIWKNYRLPLGLLVMLVIGGIALTSGESIYIIAASVAGVLGTIAGVTNSANLLRGQIKA